MAQRPTQCADFGQDRVAWPVVAADLTRELVLVGDDRPFELAAAQHGIVAAWQVRELGLTRDHIRKMRSSKRWEQVHPNVFRHVSVPSGKAQHVVSRLLSAGPGAFLSHESAASWWGHRGCRLLDPLTVTSTRRRKTSAPGLEVFHVHSYDPRWVVQLDGIQIAAVELTALQLFATMSYGRAERLVDRLWSMRLTSGSRLLRFLGQVGKRGRNGTAALRVFVDARGEDYRPPDSGLEARVEQVLARAGIAVRRQVDLGGDHEQVGRVDFVHASLQLVIEVQSELFHSSLTDREADRSRIANLEMAGFRVAEVREEWLWTDPRAVVETVRREIGALRGQ